MNIDRLQAEAMLYRRFGSKYIRFVFLVVAILVLVGSLGTSAASTYYSLMMESRTTISPPEVTLQEGTVGASTIYANSTSAKVSVTAPIYDFVDINTGDVDSIADKGTHSNFSAQQAGPDSIYDTMAELEKTELIEDYVDNISDVDSSPDIGTHSSFNNMKAYDSTYDTLNETASGGGIQVTQTVVEDFNTPAGTTHDITLSTADVGDLWVVVIAANPDGTGTVPNINLPSGWNWIGTQTNHGAPSDGMLGIIYRVKQSGDSGTLTTTYTQTCMVAAIVVTYEGVDTTNPLDVAVPTYDVTENPPTSPDITTVTDGAWVCRATLVDGAPGFGDSDIPSGTTLRGTMVNNPPSNGQNLGFADEVQETAGSAGSADWGSGAGTEEAVSATFALRPASGSEDYDLDLEIQFTNIIDFLSTEKLCVYMGTMGAEALNVSYWTGSGWSLLDSDLTASSWNNYTVSLSGANFTIRFETATLAGDSSADEYQVDAVLLQCSGVGTDEDYIDQTSDVDSTSDVGSHNVFANLQASDDTYDNMTEAGGGGGDYDTIVLGFSPDYRWELDGDETDSVDGANSDGGIDPSWVSNIIPNGATQCGDYDGSTDETLIPNQADINTAATYQKSISVWVEIDTIDTTARFIWGEGGSFTALALYVYDNSGTDTLYYVISEDSGATQDILSWTGVTTGTLYHILITMDTSAGTMYMYVNGSEVASKTGGLNIGSDLAAHTAGAGIGGDDSALLIHTGSTASGQFNGRIADVAYYAEQTVLDEDDANEIYTAGVGGGGDYQLELEVQFTNIPSEADSLAVQNLCIKAGTMGAEDLLVQYWNGSAWTTLLSDLTASAWNNVTIAGNLTASTFTIRFRDGTQSGDTSTSDSWLIDSVLIYLENSFCYELDLEVQWTSAEYTRTNEELCIKTGTFTGSENIQVRVWNSTASSWHWVMNLTANQWNNVSITSYLTSSTFTVQFLGGTETDDTAQDNWNIDATLLHVWTREDNYDYVDNNTSDVDSSADEGTHGNFTAQQYFDNINDTLTESGSVGGAIGKLGTDTSASGTTSPLQFSHTLVAGTNRLVVVSVGFENNGAYGLVSATYGGQAMTSAVNGSTATSGYLYYCEIFYILDADLPSEGSNQVSISVGGTIANFEINAICAEYENVTQGTPEDYGNTDEAFPADDTIENTGLSFTTDAWVISAVGCGNGGGATSFSHAQNQQEILDFSDGSSTFAVAELRGANGEATLESTYATGANRLERVCAGWTEVVGTDYQLDLEVQFTNVNYSLPNGELCIGAGATGAEDVKVDVWNGTEWVNMLTDLTPNNWNNVSVSSYLTSSNFTIRFKGGNEVSDNTQDSWNIDATLLHVWTNGESFDYVLKVNNTVTDSWQIRLKKYSDSNIDRLQNCTIYFHNSTDGNLNQIEIQNGAYINETGSWYDLGSSETIYIALTVQANSAGISHISTYLEVRKPGTSIYAQYIITLEIK